MNGRRWWADTLAKRLFLLMWAALVASHLLAWTVVTWGPEPRPGAGPGAGPGTFPPTFPSLPPTPGLAGPPALPSEALLLDYGLRMLVIALAAWWGSRWLAAPVRRLVAAAHELGPAIVGGQALPRLDEHSGSQEVREAAAVFNQMAAQLQGQFKDRGLLMAAISHDLRTPLTRLRMRLETMEVAPLPRERSIADLREMNALIDQALELFRGQASAEAALSIDLAALLQSLCDDLAEQGQAASFQGAGHAVTRLPPQTLRRVLNNLIGNALRYGSAAEITLAAAEGGWLICIADRGPGIPAELLEAVFEPFFRVEGSRNRDTGGTGLGLYIASDLTRLLGGRLSLNNRPEGGLSARLWLPQR